MQKRKKWQFWLLLSVFVLTIYNILPTLFYYSKPLKQKVGEKEAWKVASSIVERVDSLEGATVAWVKAQSKNLGIKLKKCEFDPEDPKIVKATFARPADAQLFAQTLYRAGSLIPFVPAQLTPDKRSFGNEQNVVIIQRKMGVHLDPKSMKEYFLFVPKEEKGEITKLYRDLVIDRAAQIALAFGGPSETAVALSHVQELSEESLLRISRTLTEYDNAFGDTSPITRRYFSSFTEEGGKIHALIGRLEALSGSFSKQITEIQKSKPEGGFLSSAQQGRMEILQNQKSMVEGATAIIKRNISFFEKAPTPLTYNKIVQKFQEPMPQTKVQTLDIGNLHPFIQEVRIDWNREEMEVLLHPEVKEIRSRPVKTEADAILAEKLQQLLFHEMALAARSSKETITPSLAGFTITLNQVTNSSSLLALDLERIAREEVKILTSLLSSSWQRESIEFAPDVYPMLESTADKPFGLMVFAPTGEKSLSEGFRRGSLYVIAKGVGLMRSKYAELGPSEEKRAFEKDLASLQEIMRQNGFISYWASASSLAASYKNDLIFELDDYASYLLAATREDFTLRGSKHYALLEFTDLEQRLLTLNKIETRIQEDLVRWRDEYRAAHVSLDPRVRAEVPSPTKNVFLSNLALSTKKYFRGDERKVLKWGLDLSGGKTVRIGLRDQNNQLITGEDDLKQAASELYQRVNRLGVSEVAIRQEGSSIVLDFPGSQNLSAKELIQAAAMYFHVVNEKFTPQNALLSEAVGTFLEEVWNEAVIKGRTDAVSLNEIAWQHLGGSLENPEEFHPLSSHARLLYEHGLRLAGPKAPQRSQALDETFSAITRFRGETFADWQGQTHPLLIVFRNYALEGANLAHVQVGYDPQQGNMLHFDVEGSYVNSLGERINPREGFYSWTSQFAEDKIGGTEKESYSQGRGWRMAVILNGTTISAPALHSALRESARITGSFTQREINQLAADLKAGSLSFTPTILSEENVSPDLGKEQRIQGAVAAILAIALVFAIMCSYYRFAGLVASIAVLFNLLIIWGVLQNLDAALTLPGIAGIILALGMAVDANVLVFERIQEEFSLSGRLPSAVQSGYRRAFSAIIDSNLTTIIAALILLNFDAGPIKGFALTLIVGIVSSMFTALFMTRYFFSGWVQNPAHKELKMSRLFKNIHVDFLKRAKPVAVVSVVIILVGAFFLVKERETIFGMDFTGGYALTVDVQERSGVEYRLRATDALVRAGASQSDFQIKELNKPNQLRIQLATSMEKMGKPFAELEKIALPEEPLYPYQSYPRIVWIVNALAAENLEVNPASLPELNLHWTEMSGQLSHTMRNQAFWGLGLALLCILIYITFRFEFTYAISATLALAHDLLITLGLLAILHIFRDSIKIDLQVIGALMTIVGYSLNDTIIIFDRIREDLHVMRKNSLREIINHALNITLGRTMMTSGTTLAVLLALLFLGGSSIFNFALIMTIGVAVGTLSSLFIASPLLLYFHNRKEIRHEEPTDKSSLSKKA